MKIVEAEKEHMPIIIVHGLFLEYQQWLGIDLCFQGFEQELASLPGRYASPDGAIFLAIDNGIAIGCVGIRPREEREAELKRLYVRPENRRQGVGKELLDAAMARAKEIGYLSIVLDTLPTMQVAKSLYLDYGFKKIPAYYQNSEEGVEYYRHIFR